jgi:hypothetical protein
MNESTASARMSRFAPNSHFWGVLSLLLLAQGALFVLAVAVRPPLWAPGEIRYYSACALVCHGLAGLAALAALVMGVVALGDFSPTAGQVAGRAWAVSGLATATLTVLLLAVVYGPVLVSLAVSL